jgi:small-conductance mechanosensitive channel
MNTPDGTPPDGPRRALPDTARRVRVTSPRTSAARRTAGHTGTREIDEQTRVGEVYMSSLIQSQLRLALVVIAGTAVILGSLPLLFFLVPVTRTLGVFGIPLPWLLLGVVVYPVVYVAARIYVRNAERIEAEFTEFVGRQ